MIKSITFRFACIFISLCVLVACGSEDKMSDREERDYQRKLKEAQELADKIRNGDIFNEEAQKQELKLRPTNVCLLSADFSVYDFGPSPDFKLDGNAVLYADKSAIVYYFLFNNRQRYKIWKNGRNPSFGALPDEGGDQRFIVEYFKLRENSWEGDSHGLLLNTESNWLNDPKLLTDKPASDPFLVEGDKTVIFKNDGKCFQQDENMMITSITKDRYNELRNSRYKFEHQWKIATSYKGLSGVWITDLEEKNWRQLRSLDAVETVQVIPEHYAIYTWGKEAAGVLVLQPSELPQYTIQLLDATKMAQEGDLFDLYEKKTSPISHDVIGYHEDKYKGTVRVIRKVNDKLVCEFQTKLHLTGIFKDDTGVSQRDNSIQGRIL